MEVVGGAGAGGGSSLIKHLASSNKAARDKALRSVIKNWLPNQTSVSEEEMRKLWKGLFYCVWHADKFPVQSELIDRLSSLLLRLDLPLAEEYFSVFLLTMRREWTGIDALRLDKFYLLIRRFLHYFFGLLSKHSWDLALSRRLVGVLKEQTFFAEDELQGNGVNYHVASVFLEELRPFLPVRLEVLKVLFEPFLSAMERVPDKVLLGKIKANVFDSLLDLGKKLLEERKSANTDGPSDGVVEFGTIALKIGFSKALYDLGSSLECCQGNRKVLFALHAKFLKLETDFASSGIELSIPDAEEQDDEEVPTLIPIASNGVEATTDTSEGNAEEITGDADKPPKKQKKPRKASATGKKAKKKKEGSNNLVPDNTRPAEICEKSEAGDKESPVLANGGSSDGEHDGNLVRLNESIMSNLQMQFEKVAAEAGLQNTVDSSLDLPIIAVKDTLSKKRKRVKVKVADGKQTQIPEQGELEEGASSKSEEKSAKKVKFSMKNNLVWQPHSPLPPQSLRLPPSATPRGSALKKGVPPGPITEMAPTAKKVRRRAVSVKKAKGVKSVGGSIKRPKKKSSLTVE